MENNQQISCPYNWDQLNNSLKISEDDDYEDYNLPSTSSKSVLPTTDHDWAESVFNPKEEYPILETARDTKNVQSNITPEEKISYQLDQHHITIPDHLTAREESKLISEIKSLVFDLSGGSRFSTIEEVNKTRYIVIKKSNCVKARVTQPEPKTSGVVEKDRRVEQDDLFDFVLDQFDKGLKVKRSDGKISKLTWSSLNIRRSDVRYKRGLNDKELIYKYIIKHSPNYPLIVAKYEYLN
ncbi:phosphoprotein [Manitoba virus]|uniref:Phosphoprotein n=1 Tax=Manitoba virus TaxID=1272949 RepID=A0A0D3R1H2_9RHAB|nr:phosphoprotein [Manitoba virus]AJR28466.1 phosphoprotein [Manitoba virus]